MHATGSNSSPVPTEAFNVGIKVSLQQLLSLYISGNTHQQRRSIQTCPSAHLHPSLDQTPGVGSCSGEEEDLEAQEGVADGEEAHINLASKASSKIAFAKILGSL